MVPVTVRGPHPNYNIHLHGTKWSLFLASLLSACEVSFAGSCIKTLLVSVSHDWFVANPKLAEVRLMMLMKKGNIFSFRVSGWWNEPWTSMNHVQSKQILTSFMRGMCFRRSLRQAAAISQTSPKTSFIFIYSWWRLDFSKAENRLLRSLKTTHKRGFGISWWIELELSQPCKQQYAWSFHSSETC